MNRILNIGTKDGETIAPTAFKEFKIGFDFPGRIVDFIVSSDISGCFQIHAKALASCEIIPVQELQGCQARVFCTSSHRPDLKLRAYRVGEVFRIKVRNVSGCSLPFQASLIVEPA